MKWMKERDLLIAQTMAFVQSVTGKVPETVKPPEAAKAPEASIPLEASKTLEADNPVAAPAAPRTSETLETARRPAVLTPAEIALALPQTALPVAMPVEVQPIAVKAPIVEAPAAAPREIPSPVAFPRLDLREDFQSEIRARVASFRAHQERFSREREAYCAATMAKVHAVLKDGDLPPLPQSGK